LIRAAPTKREEIKAFLLREDPTRYQWVNNLHADKLRPREKRASKAN